MTRSKTTLRLLPALALTAIGGGVAAPAVAQDAGDIGLTVENGRIITNLISEEGGGTFVPRRLFIAELGEVEFESGSGSDGGDNVFQDNLPPDLANVTNTPGFDSPEAAFTPGTAVNFTVQSGPLNTDGDLRVYDTTTDSFLSTDVAPGTTLGESLGISFDAQGVQTNPAVPGNVAFPSLSVFGDGRYHRHFTFVLLPVDDPNSSSPMFTGDEGVYLLELTASTTTPGIDASDPFFILFPFGVAEDSAEFAAASTAAQALVPEPASAALIGVAVLPLLLRRRTV